MTDTNSFFRKWEDNLEMSTKDLISPYLNRFVVLLHLSIAKVELSCEDGKLSVNLFHDLGVVEDATPEPVPKPREPLYANVLKKKHKTIPTFQAPEKSQRSG